MEDLSDFLSLSDNQLEKIQTYFEDVRDSDEDTNTFDAYKFYINDNNYKQELKRYLQEEECQKLANKCHKTWDRICYYNNEGYNICPHLRFSQLFAHVSK